MCPGELLLGLRLSRVALDDGLTDPPAAMEIQEGSKRLPYGVGPRLHDSLGHECVELASELVVDTRDELTH